MKFSQAISRVKWLSGENNQRFEDRLCSRPQGTCMTIVRENVITLSRR